NDKNKKIEESEKGEKSEKSEEIVRDKKCLLLAHHEEDQAETILLRLFRGTGPLGLGGMNKKNKLGQNDLIRPLLHCSKEDIIHYARSRNLKWIEDESNQDTR